MTAQLDTPETERSLRITWLGHATVLVESSTTALLFDPALRGRIAHIRRRVPVPTSSYAHVDAVLLSHAHHDHLDLGSLRRVRRHASVELGWHAPRGAARILERARIAPVERRSVGDRVQVGDVTVKTVPAAHAGIRLPWQAGEAGAEAVGYVVESTSGVRVWFAGDTSFDPDVLGGIGPVDVALVPVGGWWRTLGPGHMDGAEAARAAELVEARIAIPIHWGTFHPIGLFAAMRSIWDDPARDLERALDGRIDVRILQVGESTTVEPVQRHGAPPT